MLLCCEVLEICQDKAQLKETFLCGLEDFLHLGFLTEFQIVCSIMSIIIHPSFILTTSYKLVLRGSVGVGGKVLHYAKCWKSLKTIPQSLNKLELDFFLSM